MDETIETQENPLSETEKASEGSEGTTPTTEAKTHYTQEELEKLLQADRIKRGRDDKSLTDRKATLDAQAESLKAGLAKIDEWERQRDAEELAEAKEDPDKWAKYQAEQVEKRRARSLDERESAIAKREQEQNRKEAEYAGKVKVAEEVTLGMKLYEIAARYEINPEDLKKDMKDLNLTTEAQVESLAKRLKPTGERPPEGETKGEERITTPVSVPTIGGKRTPTAKELDAMTPEQYAAWRKGTK